MSATLSFADSPTVSIIVPARNEEASLVNCLQSLTAQAGVSFEIIVVDDHSTDRTREIASAFQLSTQNLRLIEAAPLPSGWTGKNNAVTCGAALARGEWLLFTDADTYHLPGSLQRSLADAQNHDADMLSYSPEQVVGGWMEKAVMPVIFADLAQAFSPERVSDPSSPAAAANGQYILIKRGVYEAVGGHTAVAASLLEDVDLARVVKRSGRQIFFRFGGDAVRTRMYRSSLQLREGWTKNLALLFQSPLQLACLRSAEFLLIFAGAAVVITQARQSHKLVATGAAAIAVAVYSLFIIRVRRAHFSWDANLLALFGLPVFAYLLLQSKLAHRRGEVRWKDRSYAPSKVLGKRVAPPPIASNSRTQDDHGLSHAQS